MKMKNAFAPAVLLALMLVLAGCIGAPAGGPSGSCPVAQCPAFTHQPAVPPNQCACVPDTWLGDWYSISLIAIFTLIFAIGLLYMVAEGFDLQHLKLSLREEFVQSIVTILLIFGLAAFIWSAENFILPQLASTAKIDPVVSPINSFNCPAAWDTNPLTGATAFHTFAFAQCYTETIKSTLASFTATIESLAISVGKASSVTTYCQVLGGTLGFAITSLRYVGSTQGTLGLAMTALTTAQITMHAEALLLSLSQQFLVFLLPLGVLLRSIRPTRQAGGALIAIAVGFYFIYPLTVLVDYTMVKDNAFGTGAYSASSIKIPPEITCNALGECNGDAQYLAALVGTTGTHAAAKAQFIEPMAFWTIIVSILLPVMNLLITLTFIRWFSSAIGSEIEVSQLARVT
ncbi:MAG: hypothetical protein WC759_02805 [Candidatus Micrarchaeia archaeon]